MMTKNTNAVTKLALLGFAVAALLVAFFHNNGQQHENQQNKIRKNNRRNLKSLFSDPHTLTRKTNDNLFGNNNNFGGGSARTGIADGCYHVYLDVGSNIGVHARFLFESHLYPDAVKAHEAFNTYFGTPTDRNNRDICIFAFEPNPAHRERLELLERIYKGAGWKFHAYMVGVGASDDGGMTFYHQPNDEQNSEWGFGTTAVHNQESQPVEIPVIDLTSWIETEITNRRLPEDVYGNYEKTGNSPKVVMKIDIEGQEYLVIPKLMFSNVLCRSVDYVFTEDHPGFFQFTRDPSLLSLGIQNQDDAKVYFTNIMKSFEIYKTTSPSCRTTIDMMDDESYHNDGIEGGLIPV